MARISKKTLTGRRARQQDRRLEAAVLFEDGKSRAEVAQRLKVSWQSANTWFKRWNSDGAKGLEATTKPGPPAKFSDEQVELIRAELTKGALAEGYPNELWTLSRVKRLIKERMGMTASVSEVWRLLRRMAWSPQKPHRKARERDEEKISTWKTERWPELQAKAEREKRTIIFIDECGFSQKTTAKKTWAPTGQTPTLQMTFHWDKLSVIGGISIKSLWFAIHEESIKSEQVIGFLDQLKRQVKGKLLIIWDGLPAHRSKAMAQYLGEQNGRIWVERLPAYAPELNPIEYLWGNVKGNDLANDAPKDLWELSEAARRALIKKRRRPRLIRAFWKQTELKFDDAA
jgi:transposase